MRNPISFSPKALPGAMVIVAAASTTGDARAADQHAIFAVFVNGVSKGDFNVILRVDDVLVLPRDLRDAGLHGIRAREIQTSTGVYWSLKSVKPALQYALDEKELELRITAPPSVLPHTTIKLREAPTELKFTQDGSWFLNYAPRLELFHQLDVTADGGLTLDGRFYYSSASYSTRTGAVRGVTYVSIDDRPNLRRLNFGDTTVTMGPLGGNGTYFGVTLDKAFDIDPYFIPFPTLSFSGAAMTPSTVEVYVNGQRISRQQVAPGTFDIQALRAPAGASNVTYVVRDAFGNARTLDAPVYVSLGVLSKGVSDYTFTVGGLRRFSATDSFSYDAPGALAFYRHGVTQDLTVGGRVEVRPWVVSGGGNLAVLSRIGEFDLEVAASADNGGLPGLAALAGYSFTSRYFTTGVNVLATSDDYVTLSLPRTVDRSRFTTTVITSVPVFKGASLNGQYSFTQTRDHGSKARVAASSNFTISSGVNLYTVLGVDRFQDTTSSYEGSVVLNFTVDRLFNVGIGSQSLQRQTTSSINVTKATPIGPGWGIRGDARIGDQAGADLTHELQTTFGRYTTDFAWTGRQATLALTAAGAITYVHGAGHFLTSPISQSYGVIRVPGIEGIRGYLNHQDIGSTNKDGSVFVPTMLSNYGNVMSINEHDIPMGYRVDNFEAVLAPPTRGAVVATFPATRPRYYRGRVVVTLSGNEVTPEYGQITIIVPRGENIVSPLGKKGEFELEGAIPGRPLATVEWAGGTCDFRVSLPDATESIIDLGRLRCARTGAEVVPSTVK